MSFFDRNSNADRHSEFPITGTPRFIITIDTEGDNLWDRPYVITTQNAESLPRFQRLCEKYGFKPTYLTNYEMANFNFFKEFGSDILQRGTGEIGMHLHAWDMPCGHKLTNNDIINHPYLIDYNENAIHDMVSYMTELLSEAFGVRPVSHRAGRWAINEIYARALIDDGYTVDCSVTPHVSWKEHSGNPGGSGGSDYRGYPRGPYFMDANNISQPGRSKLLEVPMTIMPCRFQSINNLRDRMRPGSMPSRILNHFFPELCWLRPNGENLGFMKSIVNWAIREKHDYIEFMLHSSELMAGCSRRFSSEADIDNLYHQMEILFEFVSRHFVGSTLEEFRNTFPEN